MSSVSRLPDTAADFDVVAVRRDLHAHPEIAYHETRTTRVIMELLRSWGLSPSGLLDTGVVCDIGSGEQVIALRADIDALPLTDEKAVPYRSVVDGMCHGCGHDAHTAILLGAAHALALEPPTNGRVRLIFQPAEETVPGGAFHSVATGVLDGVSRVYALHCDPRLETGTVGVRVGAITAACDHIEVTVTGAGGHTARPHLTQDVVYALGRLITDLPGVLSRRVDPRASLALVWGSVQAGRAANAIPTTGTLRGTLRVFGHDAWISAGPLVRDLVAELVAPLGAHAEVDYTRGVPSVVNDPSAVAVQRAAVLEALGEDALVSTEQSMGGEDFAWYLESVAGALARLGVRRADGPAFDLHQGTFDIDEAALDVGVRYTVALARAALADAGAGLAAG